MIIEALFGYIYDRLFIWQLGATLTTFGCLRIIQFYQARKRRFRVFKQYGIPSPEARLYDGNLYIFEDLTAKYRVEEALAKKYGRCFGYLVGDEASLIITDLEVLRKIFFESSKSFKERSKVFMNSTMAEGILFARHERWKMMRKTLSPTFSSYNMRGSESTQFVETSVRLMVDYIGHKLDEAKDLNKDADIDIFDLMKATALHLISSLAINLPNVQVKEGDPNVKSLDSFLSSADKGIVIWAIRFPFIINLLEFLFERFEYNDTMGKINRSLQSLIDKTLAILSSPDGENIRNKREFKNNVMNVLIKLHHEGKMTRREIIGNAEALLFAGYDTTATTLTYIFWVLSKYPDKQDRLREELKAHGVESKYLLQIINETMRLYPTVISFTSRLATETVHIDGITIPQGTKVIYNSWLAHRNPEHWPDPEKFDEDRFKEGVKIHPCAFGPFGLGDRKCLGYQLAMLELKMVICDILLHYKLSLKSPEILEIQSYAVSLTKPKTNVLIRLERL